MDSENVCKNCGTKLLQKSTKHKASQLSQPYYYIAYYLCPNCGRLYHDEKFKVVNNPLFASPETYSKTKPNHDLHADRQVHSTSESGVLNIWTDGACVFNGQVNARAAWAFVSGETEKAGLV